MEDRVHREHGASRLTRSNDVLLGAHLSLSVEGSQPVRAAASQGTASSVQQSLVGPAHVRLGIQRGQATSGDLDMCGRGKRARKERGPNWNGQEIYKLIAAKRKIALLEADTRDERQLMIPEASKWMRISSDIQAAGVSSFPRDAVACKSKWGQLIPEYKRISDYFTRSGRNEITYWTMSSMDRMKEGLPRTFPHDVFYQIREWYGKQPAVLPPHSRDFTSTEDATFFSTQVISPQVPADGSHEVSIEAKDTAAADTDSMMQSTESPPTSGPLTRGPSGNRARQPSRSASPMPRLKRSLPAGVTPQVLSSSNTTGTATPKRPASTTVRRKSLSGHSLIAEVTKSTGASMANEIREMVVSGRQLELSKIDLQQTLFKQQMDYQRERDLRSQENAKFKNEQSKLSLQKQSKMVKSLVNLSTVLKATFLSRQFANVVDDSTPIRTGAAAATVDANNSGQVQFGDGSEAPPKKSTEGHSIQ